MHSTESYVGLPSGDVIRTNAVARVRSDQCWDRRGIEKLTGTPYKPSMLPDNAVIEGAVNPHLGLDEEVLRQLDIEDDQDPLSPMPVHLRESSALPSLRVTNADPQKYGDSP